MAAQLVESENQKLFDRAVQHYMETRKFEKFLQREQEKLTASHKRGVRKLLRENIRNPLRKLYDSYTRKMTQLGVRGVHGFVSDEVDFQMSNLRASAGNFYSFRSVPKRKVADAFLKKKIFDKLPMQAQYGNIGAAALDKAESLIKRGVADGKPFSRIIDEVAKSADVSGAQAKTLLRTSITQAEVEAALQAAEANPGLVKGFEYTAILDGKTSSICKHEDGRILTPDQTSLFPPRHFNCRSSVSPVLYSRDEMLELDDSEGRFKRKKLKKVSRTRLNGAPSKREDFSQWLSRQPHEVKLGHLGSEEKVALFESGGLEVKDFFSSAGRPLALKELKLKSASQVFGKMLTDREPADELLQVRNTRQLLNNPKFKRALTQMYLDDSTNAGQPLSLVDYRGVTLGVKRATRHRTHNVFDERNMIEDPFTGEVRSNLLYDPDFELYRDRVDFMRNSKLLSTEQKDFVESVADSLQDKVSLNQQTTVVENLRLVLERNAKEPQDWENLAAILRGEMKFSVTNVSRRLDRISRRKDQLFDYDPDSPPSVFIQGDRITFDEIVRDFRKDALYINRWEKKYGEKLARKFALTGKSPFVSFFDRRDYTFKAKLTNAIESVVPGVKQLRSAAKSKKDFLDRYWRRNKETHLQQFIREKKEQLHKILNLEFELRSRKSNWIDDSVGRLIPNEKDQVRVMARMFKHVGEGRQTDFDGLAITLGEKFHEEFGWKFPWMGTTIRDKHRTGSAFLNAMVKAKLLRVDPRATVRRSVIDLETGRPGKGGWKDTVSREVKILDKDMLELQKRERKQVIGFRLGVVNKNNDLHIRVGDKDYYTSFGDKTGQSVITSNASKHFDPELLGQDVVDFINKGKAFQYEVDPEFVPFMNRVLRFRDPRGNTEYFDSINGFRKEILTRADMGEGMMQTALYHLKRGKPFRARAQIDSRGRLYFNGYLQPTGGELVRPFLNTHRRKPITSDGVRELQYHLGSLLGDADQKLSNRGRLRAFREFEGDLLKLGANIQSKTQPDRRIREFLENRAITAVDDVEAPIIARFALEYKRIHDHTGGDVLNPEKLEGYRTQLLGEIDASASAVQMISLITGNKNMATVSNVIETKSKNRIYDLVAQDTKADPRLLALEKKMGVEFSWEELTKGAKTAVMLRGYGSGKPGLTARVSKGIAKLLGKRDITAITRQDFLAEIKPINEMIKAADAAGAGHVAESLRQLRKEMEEAMGGSAAAAREAMDLAEDYAPDSRDFIQKFLSPRNERVNPEDFKELANIMLEKLEERAPGMDDYIQFWKKASVAYIEDSKEVKIPFRTFDNKRWHLKYRPTVEHEVRFWDPKSRKYVKNIYKGETSDRVSLSFMERFLGKKKNPDKYLGKASITKARTGFGVSLTHANDAAALRLMYREADKAGLDIASIHDAVVGNLTDLPAMREMGRIAYAKAREARVIQNTLEDMRKNGLSERKFKELKKLAEDSGLLREEFTGGDILERKDAAYFYYGWDR